MIILQIVRLMMQLRIYWGGMQSSFYQYQQKGSAYELLLIPKISSWPHILLLYAESTNHETASITFRLEIQLDQFYSILLAGLEI